MLYIREEFTRICYLYTISIIKYVRMSITEIDPWIEIWKKDRGKRELIRSIFQGREESGDAAIRDTRIARM